MKPQLDLPSKYLKQLVALIDEYLTDAQVWAYGSRIKQQNHDTSDLDLVVLMTDSDSLSKVLGFREVLRQSNLPILIDVMDWNIIPKHFKEEIKQCHVSIYPPS